MKKLFKILLGLISPLIICGGIYAYVSLTAHVDVTVSECLSWVSNNEFTVNLMPGESQNIDLIIHNSSSVPLEVTLKDTVTPKIKGLNITLPDTITAIAGGDTTATMQIVATPSVEPGATSITVNFDR